MLLELSVEYLGLLSLHSVRFSLRCCILTFSSKELYQPHDVPGVQDLEYAVTGKPQRQESLEICSETWQGSISATYKHQDHLHLYKLYTAFSVRIANTSASMIIKGFGKEDVQLRNPELGKSASAIGFTIFAIVQLTNISWGEVVHNGPELAIQSKNSSRCSAEEAHPHRYYYGATWSWAPMVTMMMLTTIMTPSRHSSRPSCLTLLKSNLVLIFLSLWVYYI